MTLIHRPVLLFDPHHWRRTAFLFLVFAILAFYHQFLETQKQQRVMLQVTLDAAAEARALRIQAEAEEAARQQQAQTLFDTVLAPPYTKLDYFGEVLASEAKQWQCVRSNDTGLVWEIKTRDGGLRDATYTYSWFHQAREAVSGLGDGGSCLYSNCDTQGYIDALNQRRVCGIENWRLPTTRELQTLVTPTRYIPKIDTRYFPNGQSYYYWTDTVYANFYDPEQYASFPGVQAFQYWSEILSINDYSLMTSVNFLNGLPYGARKSRNYHIRLVSGSRLPDDF